MAEGIAAADGTITGGVHDDPDSPPAPTAEAPKGWAWDRKRRNWQPRQRGKVLWHADSGDAPSGPVSDSGGAAGRKDPAPAWEREDAASKPEEPDIPVTAAMRDDLAGLVTLFTLPPVSAVAKRDPHCGGALADNYERIVETGSVLLLKSRMIRKFVTSGDVMAWAAFGAALKPVAVAVVQHHVLKTVVTAQDEETGARVAVPADYSMYTAA